MNWNKLSCLCGKMATWLYLPCEESWACCDDCVPKGCSCNEWSVIIDPSDLTFKHEPDEEWVEGVDWEWIEKDITWRELEEGKPIPCCEWIYDKEGFDK